MSTERFGRYCLFCLLMCLIGAASADELSVAEQAYAQGKYYAAGARFQILANNGDAQAQFRLGEMHATGRGLPQNFEQAVMWYRKAAAQGHAAAASELIKQALQGIALTAPPPEGKHLGTDIQKKPADAEAANARTGPGMRQATIEREIVVWPAVPRKHPQRKKPARGVTSPAIWTPKRPYLPAPGTRYQRYK